VVEAFHPFDDNGYVKICLNRGSPVNYEELFARLRKKNIIKKDVTSSIRQDRYHQPQVNMAGAKIRH
jgi:hypothetical protein